MLRVHPTTLFVAILLLQGCAATDGVERTDLSVLKVGASQADVEEILGSPVEIIKAGEDDSDTVITYAYNKGAKGDPNLIPTCPPNAHYMCGGVLLFMLPYTIPKSIVASQRVYTEQRGKLYVTYGEDQRVRSFETEEYRDFVTNSELLVTAIEQGDSDAVLKLSQYAWNQSTSSRDVSSRSHWLCLAAHSGDGRARYFVADHYRYGYGDVSVDQAQAYMWYSLAEESGLTTAHKKHVAHFLSPDQLAQGERLLEVWEPNPSECGLAAMTGPSEQSGQEPELVLLPKEWGQIGEQPTLRIVDRNTGVEVRDAAWLEKRARVVDAEAAYVLAHSELSTKNRFRLYCLSAHRGYGKAQERLAFNYRWGFAPLPRDQIAAYKWLSLAESNGVQTPNKSVVAQDMSPEQIALAERLVAEWKPNPIECETISALGET